MSPRATLASLLLLVPCMAGAGNLSLGAACESAAAGEPFVGVALEISDLGGCRGCARSIERALGRSKGVLAAELDPDLPVVCIAAGPSILLDEASLRQAVKDVGYTSGVAQYRVAGGLLEGTHTLVLEPGAGVTIVLVDPEQKLADLALAGERVLVAGELAAQPEGGWALRVSSVTALATAR
jgi:copper chaperone CopZ